MIEATMIRNRSSGAIFHGGAAVSAGILVDALPFSASRM
jgi:hypothetical protein